MMNEAKLIVIPEDTPNPNSTKFTLNRTLLDGPGEDFPNVEAAARSPLVRELFMLPGVRGVYIGPNFVTVSVHQGTDWWSIRPLAAQTIETFFASGRPILNLAGAVVEPPAAAQPPLTAIELGIRQILENEIQPAVAMDGGFIAFDSYADGVVRLQLHGACHSCPSSIVTLKAGIESRLKQEFPEIVAVEAV